MDDPTDVSRLERDRARGALLVARWREGDERAFGELYDAWFDRVHDLAGRIVRDPGRAAEVAQDAFLTAWRRIDGLDDPASFGGWLLRITRNRALDVQARERRSVALDDETLGALDDAGGTMNGPDGPAVGARVAAAADPARAVEDAELVTLLWSAADALGERDRSVLDLHLRHGLTPAEIGEVVGVNRNAANQLVHRVKGRLADAVAARLLWRGARPGCPELRAALDDAGVRGFDAQAVKLAGRHAETCDDCSRRRPLALEPSSLFGALPIVAAPVAVKQHAAAALASQGVPMDGSQHTGTPPTGGRTPGAPGDGAGSTPAAGTSAVAPTASGAGRRRWALAAVLVAAILALGAATVLALDDGSADGDATNDDLATAADTAPASGAISLPAVDVEPVEAGPATVAEAVGHPAAPTTDPVNAAPGTSELPLVPPPPSSTAPPVVVIPPPASSTTVAPSATTTTMAPSASLDLSPDTVGTLYIVTENYAPVLTWSTSGAHHVRLQGPGVDTAATSGSLVPCPGSLGADVCTASAGPYRYRLRLFAADGTVLRTLEVVLTVA